MNSRWRTAPVVSPVLFLIMIASAAAVTSPSRLEGAKLAVAGSACVQLAGQPPLLFSSPVLPAPDAGREDAIRPVSLPVVGAGSVTVEATGSVSVAAAASVGPAGLGASCAATPTEYTQFGLSALSAPAGALVGVFVGSGVPDPATAPALRVECPPPGGTAPALQQPFFVGAGPATIAVPECATRLFLGVSDAGGWSDNTGSFSVAVTTAPAPPSFRLEPAPGAAPGIVSVILDTPRRVRAGSVALAFDDAVFSLDSVEPGADLPAGATIYSTRDVYDGSGNPVASACLAGWVNSPPASFDPSKIIPAGSHEALRLHFTTLPSALAGCSDVTFLPGLRSGPLSPFLGDLVTDLCGETLPASTAPPLCLEPLVGSFVRGDANDDGEIDVSDPVKILLWIFDGAPAPACEDSADTDDSGGVDITDAVHELEAIFRGGPLPAAPFPACGSDATPDPIPCTVSSGGCV